MSPMYVPGQWVLAVYVQNGRSKCAPVKKSFLFWVCAGTRICLLHLHVVDRGHVLLQLPTALLEGVGQRGALSGEETAGGDDRLRLEDRSCRYRGDVDGWRGHLLSGSSGSRSHGNAGGGAGALLDLRAGQGRLAHHGGEAILGGTEVGAGVEALDAGLGRRRANRGVKRGGHGGLGEGRGAREGLAAAVVEGLQLAEEGLVDGIVGEVGEGFLGIEERIEHAVEVAVVDVHVVEGEGRGLELLGRQRRRERGRSGGGGGNIHGVIHLVCWF